MWWDESLSSLTIGCSPGVYLPGLRFGNYGSIRMGRIAIKTLGLYLLTTAVAITLALSFANNINPGIGIDTAAVAAFSAPVPPAFKDVLIGISPTNPIKAMSDGNMLQVIVFSILGGVAITQAGKAGQGILSVSRILTM